MSFWILMFMIALTVVLAVTFAIISFYELTVEEVIDITAEETKEVIGEVKNLTGRVISGVS